jgi:molybdopterin-synthase adenylyltransferase
LKIVEADCLYIIPHFLPVRNYEELDDRYILDLGADVTFKHLQLDSASMRVFKSFLSPISISKVAQETGIALEDIKNFCNHLLKERLLVEYQPIPDQYKRFDRHLNYYSLHGLNPIQAQDNLKNVSITLLGVGGIGNWVALNLVGLGIKKIRLVDPDIIEESNLTRQVLFTEEDIGKSKVEVAHRQLQSRNRDLSIESIKEEIKEDNLLDLIQNTNFVVLSADKPFFSIQKWVNLACLKLKIPLLNVGYAAGEGVMGPLVVPYSSSCLACSGSLDESNYYLRRGKGAEEFTKHFRAPSFACLNSLISCMASFEIVKFFLDYGECISINHAIRINPLDFSIRKITCERNSKCTTCQPLSMM